MIATLQLTVRCKVAFPLALLSLSLCASTSVRAEGLDIDTPWLQARDNALARAINPDDYECDPTQFEEWVVDRVREIGLRDTSILISQGAFDWAFYYSLLLDNDPIGDYIGVNGEYTRELVKRHKDNQRFWDVRTDDISLHGMHGGVIADETKIVPAVRLYFMFLRGEVLSDAAARSKVRLVQNVIERNANLYYDHPMFTLNAFAFTADGQDILGDGTIIPDKIVMGDGILELLRDIGFGNNAPDFVHAHEFAHHVQFELGVFDDYDGTPEATRRTELMADSFGAYYCAHARGATFQAKRFAEVMNAAYSIGDCFFDDPSHHGTPNQREAAAIWGESVAVSATKRGHIKSAALMLELFDAQLPTLIAPDAP